MMQVDPVVLTQRLIQHQSITPLEEGCFDPIVSILSEFGFTIKRLPFPPVDNLYARFGTQEPNFCFAGHIDVVPIRPEDTWIYPPFSGSIHDGLLYGRGAVDMKGAIAAFLGAISRYLSKHPCPGSISLLLTSDEEGPAQLGTLKVLEHLQATQEKLTICLVGEPTSRTRIGDTLMIGRRGSLNADVTARGISGHVAYPHLAKNPLPILLSYLDRLRLSPLDEGCKNFEPSNLEIVSFDVGNPTYNMIPAQALARINIRYNPLHTAATLTDWLSSQAIDPALTVSIIQASESFYCPHQPFIDCVQKATHKIVNLHPTPDTSGGTSDARFIKDHCPVLELGLLQTTLHQANEHVPLEDLETLTQIYTQILVDFFQDR